MSQSQSAGWICSGIAVLVLGAGADAQAADVTVGMTSADVMKQLGNPDGIKALHGKVLREVADLEEAEKSDVRTVFIYDREKLRVWFQHGRVTATTQGTDSAPPDEPAEAAPAN